MSHNIEIRCQAMRQFCGIFDHYFVVVGDVEYHMGYYRHGNKLPKDSTKGAHVVAIKTICDNCYHKLLMNINLDEGKRLEWYYPLINCETLTTGFSLQFISFMFLPFVVFLFLKGYFLFGILLFVLALCLLLIFSKYTFSRTHKIRCRHLS